MRSAKRRSRSTGSRSTAVHACGGASTLLALEAYLDDALAASTTELDLAYGTVSKRQFYGPDFMVGKDWDGRPVALVAGDSIGEARQEYAANADGRGNVGWLRRWLDTDQGLGCVPHLMIGMPGAVAFRDLTGSGSTIATHLWDVLDQVAAFNGSARPVTVLINQYGQNDTTPIPARHPTTIPENGC